MRPDVVADAERLLCELIREESLAGQEMGAVECAARWFG